MDSPLGQDSSTRERLLTAAVDLIAERGWARVTTRAIAEHAGLPHGTVSYHFAGKQALLTEAALGAIEALAPLEDLARAGSLDALLDAMVDLVRRARGRDASARVFLECMREAERNPALRARLAQMLTAYRAAVAALVPPGDAPPAALATLLVALGDGLLLHALVDPSVDVAGAAGALRNLLAGASR